MKYREYLFIDFHNDDPKSLVIIKAKDKKSAKDKFYYWFSQNDSIFLENLYEKGDGFGANFWITQDMDKMKNYSEEEFDNHFQAAAKQYFSNFPDYGIIYLNYYYDLNASQKNTKFPDEMIKLILADQIENHNWMNLDIIDIKKIKRISGEENE